MQLFSETEFKPLAETTGQLCVSIYLPMEIAGPETRKNPIQLKNAISNAEAQLQARGIDKRKVQDILQPAEALIDDFDFWQHQQAGLALFLTMDNMRVHRLPLRFEPLVMVGDRFHLKPLLPLLASDRPYHILTLTQNRVRLFWANRYQIEELPLDDVPTSLAEALQYDDPEKQLQYHSTAGGGDRPTYHGQGVGTTDHSEDIRRFFIKLDHGLSDRLNQSGLPLMLAGVEFLHPIYHQVNSYSNLLAEGIMHDPEPIDPEALRIAAWEKMAARMERSHRAQIDRFQSVQTTDQGETQLEPIVIAAHRGQVDTLLIRQGSHRWGRYDAAHNSIEPHADEHTADTDLIDLAAMQTVLQGGTVYTLSADDMPTEEPIAAIYRYAVATPAGA